jgi:hypothetical protein
VSVISPKSLPSVGDFSEITAQVSAASPKSLPSVGDFSEITAALPTTYYTPQKAQ